MVPHTDDRPDGGQAPDRGVLNDRRVPPRGVLPRHIQTWVMVAIAVLILAIILLTSRQPSPSRSPSAASPAPPSLVTPDRVRSYIQQLAAETARQPDAVASQAGPPRAATPAGTNAPNADPLADDQRRRNYQSLFADSVALSRRSADQQPYGEAAQRLASGFPTSTPSSTASPMPVTPSGPGLAGATDAARGLASSSDTPAAPKKTGPIRADGPNMRLLEGTVIEGVLLNRLDGTFAGPVDGLVTTPVYSHDRQSIVIPAGARVLGAASPVQTWGESRLAVSFHRLVMPDGRTYSLDRFKGLDQVGDAGLKDSVNHHYLQVFGASLAIGALSGLAQYGTRSGAATATFGDDYRQAAGSSLAASTGRVLDRYLNVLPTITIHEGHRLKVYLTNDMDLPAYATGSLGGAR